jgi:hypothetical protein
MLSRLAYFLILANLTAVSVAVILGGKKPDLHFLENGFITRLNVMQLIAAAGLSLCISVIRSRDPNSGQAASSLWLLAAAGGLWFAMDETFEIHEHLGLYLSRVLSMSPPPILNQRSDPLIPFYLVAIFAVCWLSRREILHDRRALGFFAAGLGLLVVSELRLFRADQSSFLAMVGGCRRGQQIHRVWYCPGRPRSSLRFRHG